MRNVTQAKSKGARISIASPIIPPAVHQPVSWLDKLLKPEGIHAQVSNALPKHDASLQFSKDDCTPRWLDELTGDDVGDENVSRGPANNGEELSALDNQHAGPFARDDSQDLRKDSNRRHKGLDHESGARANLLDRPSGEE